MMERTRRPVLLIPAYRPSILLWEVVTKVLLREPFQAVVVVNDGSGETFASLFQQLQTIPGVYLLQHPKNLGKGAALKNGMAFVVKTFPRCCGVVTCDADGQHAAEDVTRLGQTLLQQSDSLLLGVRMFDHTTPLRSRLGNRLTRWLLLVLTRVRLQDTQTGLRGIPFSLLPSLIPLASQGYEFEMEMLLLCTRLNLDIRQIPIQTIYLDGNRSSHFNPVFDSLLIYFTLFRFALSSLLATLLDNLVFMSIYLMWPDLMASQIGGRVLATTTNFYVNRHFVFHCRRHVSVTLTLYLALTVFSTTLSFWLILWLQDHAGMHVFLAKILVETMLFFFNFTVQNHVVFPRAS